MGAFRMKQVLVKYKAPVPVQCKACGKPWGPGHGCAHSRVPEIARCCCGHSQPYTPREPCKQCGADLWLQTMFPDSDHPLVAPGGRDVG